MAEKSSTILYLARLEKARAEAKKFHSIRDRSGSSICLESDSGRWMGGCSKSYARYNDNYFSSKEEGL